MRAAAREGVLNSSFLPTIRTPYLLSMVPLPRHGQGDT